MRLSKSHWLAVPGCAVALIFAAFFLSEWYSVGVIADQSTLDAYYFGSEAMVGEGGWPYTSSRAYASMAFASGAVMLAIAGVFGAGLWKRSDQMVVVGYGLIVLGFIVQILVVRLA